LESQKKKKGNGSEKMRYWFDGKDLARNYAFINRKNKGFITLEALPLTTTPSGAPIFIMKVNELKEEKNGE